jgi:hypothetical protein
MGKNSGLTTTSLIIYVIAMMIVIGIVATITSFFYTNVNSLNDNSDNISEITKFHMYFLGETTKKDNAILSIQDSSITFASGNTFTFQDNCIYLNHIRICEDVYNLKFSTSNVNSKTVINVLITIGQNNEYTKTTKYVLASN